MAQGLQYHQTALLTGVQTSSTGSAQTSSACQWLKSQIRIRHWYNDGGGSVSSTILSQCNSFLCLRISNPDDQSYVKNLLPDSIKGVIDILSTLRRGECVLLGDAVMMPTRIKITPPNPKPDSNDVSFTVEWNKPHTVIDIPAVLDVWRKQGIETKS